MSLRQRPLGKALPATSPTPPGQGRWNWHRVAQGVWIVLYMLSSLPFVPPLASFLTPFLPVGVQVYRYVRIYDAVQRQQTKWFVFGFSVSFFFLAIDYVLGAVVPGLGAPDSWYQLLNALAWPLVWTLLLLSIGIAILRYRLWDIDVIINRTLVYGSLTILLVTLYVGLILALQALVQVLTGRAGQQPLVIVGSTLVIAALFQPLHRSIQALIDRRFYRRKYDAARITAAFSSTLRNEVDLDQLRAQLLEVVQETMQPSHVSLWVRQPSRAETPSLQAGKPPPEEAREHEEIAEHGA